MTDELKQRIVRVLKAAQSDVIGNMSRMQRTLPQAKGVLATGALKDAIAKAEQTQVEIITLLWDLQETNGV